MGRHVSPERRRSLRASTAVAVAGILLLTGVLGFAGYSIWAQVRTPTRARPTTATAPAATLTLMVTGPRCQVFVGVPGGDILVNRTLVHGQSVRFEDPRLNVVLGDAGAVQVYVNGVRRPPDEPGRRVEFTAVRS
ncbi:RodZ domain-containing protein [Actinoallomurus sp. NPDC050550]|uniref:RodZ domain-containing protein n=1 Tax=Actinoallomurus sp. NPDC050550 TaxID=3154937 RepID=UPI0033D8CEE0